MIGCQWHQLDYMYNHLHLALDRVRGKTIRSVLCNIVCNNCAYGQTNSSLDWVLSHWAHFTVLDSFWYYVLLYVVCMIA